MYFRVPLARVPSSSSLRQLQRLEWPLAQEQSFAILSFMRRVHVPQSLEPA
jgi:hypothetical protein